MNPLLLVEKYNSDGVPTWDQDMNRPNTDDFWGIMGTELDNFH